MSAGAGAASGGSLESTLDRKLQGVSNTMESIQGLSTWCIDNKKYHSLIVRHWMKCLKKSESPHRLNLIYLANDIIQNCKRKNAIVYRTAFAEVLRDAFQLVNLDGDPKVIKSVERILSIWEERGVYSGTLITELKSILVKEESPPETPVEQKTPVESKADLRSKVLAEFVPQALMDELSKYKRSVEEVDMREKQLAAMRVDICSSVALKKLKDKAGGKKFSKDFEEGSAQLQEFVKFLDKQCKAGPPLMEALSNADIFYEMQYKEVKIVANAYQTFANRVSHLKRKLDALKANLPDLDDSPIPSPSADAPSPTGSESPFHGLGLADPDPDLDGSAMEDEAEPPAPSPLSSPGGSPKRMGTLGENDNREVEDMELSDEEVDSMGIIVEDQIKSTNLEVSTPLRAKPEPSVTTEQPIAQVTPPVVPSAAALESVDLAKIGSILNSLSSVMKNTVPLVESPPAAAPALSSLKTTPAPSVAAQDPSSLVNLLSEVDMSPADLLGALSKVQGQGSFDGIASLLSSPATNVSSDSSSTGSSTMRQSTSSQKTPQASNPASALVQALHTDMELTTEPETSLSSKSLESKIHSFLQGNPAFSAFDLDFSSHPVQGGDTLSPVTAADTQGGTPVRDEGGGTPTQDEIMDKPAVASLISNTNQSSIGETFETAPVAYQKNSQQNSNNSQQQAHLQPDVAQNGQVYQPYPYGKQETSEHGITAPVAHYQQISAETGGPVPGERAPGIANSTQTAEGFRRGREGGWYGDVYPEGNSQQPGGFNVMVPGGAGENKTSGLYPYQVMQPHELGSQQGASAPPDYFRNNLPPIPKFPPPPHTFKVPPPVPSGAMIPQGQQPMPRTNTGEAHGSGVSSVISGMVVHDHQHKSMFHSDDPPYDRPRPPHPEDFRPPRPEDLRHHPENLHYQEEPEFYHDNHRRPDAPFFQEEPYHHTEEPYYRPGSPPQHYPRVRARLTPPLSPSEDPYFAHDYQRHSPPPPHYAPRRPPPHPEIRHPGMRPPLRPPHSAHHPRPIGPPRAPFPRFHGPDPRMRGKRPGPRGGGPMFAPKRPFPPPRY
ncbi:regulation of nuclear pre-mRNA domain-containing protein 2a isoform X2 [Acanthopagrus latus]|uniref:regulation of nuclear pre-mRNA domain-containing protein 2a isoform X2 n=1 Tax=Acanthopagrus latus TaxID=8177 RepID=UPI00187D01A1|nr:regulation of nuclear pre-mRNA domain-containing protein 2a isoform X2 [Acanthopagrus latus]